MNQADVTHVQKACAYITRNGNELLVFEGPGHEGLQIPKGTLEEGERPREALFREIVEESGLAGVGPTRHVASDVWTRRESPPKRYVRHFFHTSVYEPRDEWTHIVTGDGEERGAAFEFSWLELPADREFALDLDDYTHLLADPSPTPESTEPAASVAVEPTSD
ncbi:NUDIX hydrolase [Natronobiforma cellulositropha]|uniref:NUDIX hydrolase n=1 Tax=Natronobiforma cellulositropha TaxID=1679076 RepID=UPI0021D5A9DD|nr:NUDIX domain-containing protein [Natronobiforma cellulositropha]